MEKFFCFRIIVLFLLQIIISVFFIYHDRKKMSYFFEVIIPVIYVVNNCFIRGTLLFKNPLTRVKSVFIKDDETRLLFGLFLLYYIFLKIAVVVVIYLLKLISFYLLVSIAKNGIIANISYVIFGKKKISKFASKMWNKVKYGIQVRRGIPGMVNKKHKLTGIHFDKNGFPKFKSIYTVKLPLKLYKKTRETHFRYANKLLYQKVKNDKRFAKHFTSYEIKQMSEGVTPQKYTWHHHQKNGVLELVDRQIHADVNHRGGYSIWGKND